MIAAMRLITKIRVGLSILLTPFLVVLYLNIEKWAEKHGYDLILVEVGDDRLVETLTSYALQPVYQFAAVAALAFVGGIWIDALIRWLSDKITIIRPNIPTSIHIQFQVGSQNVVQLRNENIQASHFERQTFNYLNDAGKLIGQDIMWLAFLVFRKPTHYGQIIVDAGNAAIPQWEIVSQKNTFAIIRFRGDVGNVALTIRCISPNQGR